MFSVLQSHARVTVRRPGRPDPDGTCVVYWMQRAQRAADNPALDVAVEIGNAFELPVVAFFGLRARVERSNLRHYRFLLEGLQETAAMLRTRGVGFVLRRSPDDVLLPFLAEVRPAMLVGDENPLRQMEGWRRRVAASLQVPYWTVDADVVVPTKILGKEQYAARTIRPRIHARLDEFLHAGDEPRAAVAWRPPRDLQTLDPRDDLLDGFPIDRRVEAVSTFRGGIGQARRRLRGFVRSALGAYDEQRNHPEASGTSQLSPYLHFGQIGPREVALAVRDSGQPRASIEPFLEQLIVRRELAVNFVTFNPDYDRLAGCEGWARATLAQHRTDRRPYRYTPAQFEAAETHDPLWNAAQRQMVTTGWMHGYVRMYWAKKILEWTGSADEAFEIAIDLNDRYELDGRDPNGYTNIAWAIGGKHDRPWPSRPVFGTVRAMSYESTRRKFDSARYIQQYGGGRLF